MTLLRTQKLTVHQARALAKMGFIVTLVQMLCGDFDEYAVLID